MKKIVLHTICFLAFANGFSQDSVLVKKLLDQAYELEAKSPEKALEIYRKAYEVSSETEYSIGKFKAIMYSGIVKSDLGQYDSALFYYKKALPLSEKTNIPRDKAITNINIGNAFSFKGDLDSVPKYYLSAIRYFEAAKDSFGIGNAYINLAALFQKLSQTEKQIQYLKSAIPNIPEQNEELLGISYGNLGQAYMDKENSELAFKYFKLSDSISKRGTYPRLRFFNERNMGEYHFYKKSYKEAIAYYEKALEFEKDVSDSFYKNDMFLDLGLAHYQLKNFSKANYYLKEALDMGLETGAIEIQQTAALNLSEVYQSQGNTKSALDYYKTYSNLKDSLLGKDMVKTINELETKYRSEKKDREITEQQLQLEQKETALQKKQTQYSIMTGIDIILLICSLMGWFLYQQRQKRKNQEILTLKKEQQLKTLESLMEGEEKERFRIAKELHDGVNGDLSAIKYKLTSMLEHNTAVVNDVVAMIDKSSEQVRAISHNLVPPSLEKFNLKEALGDYCTKMNDVHDTQLRYQHIGEPIQIEKNDELNVYRIVQELVSNSIKHSGATKITVQTSRRENNIQITVEDNGTGFDPSAVANKGIGLSNIDSRIAYLKATKDVVSNSQGTSFTIEIDTTKLNDH